MQCHKGGPFCGNRVIGGGCFLAECVVCGLNPLSALPKPLFSRGDAPAAYLFLGII
jgi:hypothetical protein